MKKANRATAHGDATPGEQTPWSEADVVRYIVEDARLGVSGTATAKRLNQQGQRTTTGHKWTLAKVQTIANANTHLPNSFTEGTEGPHDFLADLMRDCAPGRDAPATAVERRRVWKFTHG